MLQLGLMWLAASLQWNSLEVFWRRGEKLLLQHLACCDAFVTLLYILYIESSQESNVVVSREKWCNRMPRGSFLFRKLD